MLFYGTKPTEARFFALLFELVHPLLKQKEVDLVSQRFGKNGSSFVTRRYLMRTSLRAKVSLLLVRFLKSVDTLCRIPCNINAEMKSHLYLTTFSQKFIEKNVNF
jgi:hypothetical protein